MRLGMQKETSTRGIHGPVSSGRLENPAPLLFPRIPELFFRRFGAHSVDASIRAGGWWREDSKELQVVMTDVS